MMESGYDMKFIERYFDHELNNEEIALLHERLNHDPGFQKLFEQERLLINAIRHQTLRRDLVFLEKKERELAGRKTHAFILSPWYFAAAAVVAGLIALAVVFLPGNNDTERLYEAYFKPYPNVFEPTLRGTAENTVRRQAFQAYERGEYEQAASLFKNLIREEEEAGILFLLGNAQLTIGKTDEARLSFERTLNYFDELDLEARWYLALVYLKLGQPQVAKKYLVEVSLGESVFREQARELLADLNAD